MNNEPICVGISGGQDSFVAAHLLQHMGYQPVGVYLQFRNEAGTHLPVAGNRARVAADALGIPFHVVDCRERFRRQVVDYFVTEYVHGRTPNPCVVCNQAVKIKSLLEFACRHHMTKVATGHYADIRYDPAGGRWQLYRGKDRRKDQSYFLFRLTQHQLAHCVFPLASRSKTKVRRLATRLIPSYQAYPESQEICFIPENDYNRFLRERVPHLLKEGPIVDENGVVIGTHQGIACFTVGQRRGLGIGGGSPRYVTKILSDTNTIVVGCAKPGRARCLVGAGTHWIARHTVTQPFRCRAQIRSQHSATAARVQPLSSRRVRVAFDHPQTSPTPGQAIVFYQHDLVLGGAWIESVVDDTPRENSTGAPG